MRGKINAQWKTGAGPVVWLHWDAVGEEAGAFSIEITLSTFLEIKRLSEIRIGRSSRRVYQTANHRKDNE